MIPGVRVNWETWQATKIERYQSEIERLQREIGQMKSGERQVRVMSEGEGSDDTAQAIVSHFRLIGMLEDTVALLDASEK